MKVTCVRSDGIYRKIMAAPPEKKTDIYRYELMMPFEKKWECYNIPMKPKTPGGYDVIMASGMLGHISPTKVDESQRESIEALSKDSFWDSCTAAVNGALEYFEKNGVNLIAKEYLYTVLLANRDSAYLKLSDGYCGDGGIPGYVMAWLLPNADTMEKLPAALAHEVDHNVRFQFIKWKNDITLGEMIVSEGLAENLATLLHGEDKAGPWVTKTSAEALHRAKPILKKGLSVQGLSNLNAYLYGDEMAEILGLESVGLPYCAGYACGYDLIKHYLAKTGKSIAEATILPAEEILAVTEDFWEA